jgi:hypothetical protein
MKKLLALIAIVSIGSVSQAASFADAYRITASSADKAASKPHLVEAHIKNGMSDINTDQLMRALKNMFHLQAMFHAHEHHGAELSESVSDVSKDHQAKKTVETYRKLLKSGNPQAKALVEKVRQAVLKTSQVVEDAVKQLTETNKGLNTAASNAASAIDTVRSPKS